MSVFTEKSVWIMSRLIREFGLTVDDAAAICGNGGHESLGFTKLQEMKPTVPGSRGGYGWFQWTGPRRRAFEKWCKAKNLNPSSDEANYGFLVEELKTTEKAAIPAVKKAKGLEAKVIAFEMGYERAGVKHYPSRLKYAQQALAAFKAAEVPAPPVVPPVAVPDVPATVPVKQVAGAGLIVLVIGVIGWFRDAIASFFHAIFN